MAIRYVLHAPDTTLFLYKSVSKNKGVRLGRAYNNWQFTESIDAARQWKTREGAEGYLASGAVGANWTVEEVEIPLVATISWYVDVKADQYQFRLTDEERARITEAIAKGEWQGTLTRDLP